MQNQLRNVAPEANAQLRHLAGTSGSTILFPGTIRDLRRGRRRRSRANLGKEAHLVSPSQLLQADIRSALILSLLLLQCCDARHRRFGGVEAIESFFFWGSPCLPTLEPKAVKIGDQPALFEPDIAWSRCSVGRHQHELAANKLVLHLHRQTATADLSRYGQISKDRRRFDNTQNACDAECTRPSGRESKLSRSWCQPSSWRRSAEGNRQAAAFGLVNHRDLPSRRRRRIVARVGGIWARDRDPCLCTL